MATVNGFDQAPTGSGTTVIKYWLGIEDEIEEEHFQQRIDDPRHPWKLS
jgi:polyphosphate kinase 2 (PPK2 family)